MWACLRRMLLAFFFVNCLYANSRGDDAEIEFVVALSGGRYYSLHAFLAESNRKLATNYELASHCRPPL